MDLNLTGKNALVCGSSKGIGKAIAIQLAKMGASITLVARNAERLGNIIGTLEDNETQHHNFMVADFTDSNDLKRKVKALVTTRPIHILINNTGGPPAGPILDASEEQFQQAFHNHLICNHLLTKTVKKSMIDEGYGRIINIISTSVKQPIDDLGVSNTIRAAVANWSKTLASELGPHGITVNNVLPGSTDTERFKSIAENRATKLNATIDEVYDLAKKAIPLKRLGEPAEIAAAVGFLASPAASYITGINMPVDGGRTKSL